MESAYYTVLKKDTSLQKLNTEEQKPLLPLLPESERRERALPPFTTIPDLTSPTTLVFLKTPEETVAVNVKLNSRVPKALTTRETVQCGKF